jgi:hypothetical protein
MSVSSKVALKADALGHLVRLALDATLRAVVFMRLTVDFGVVAWVRVVVCVLCVSVSGHVCTLSVMRAVFLAPSCWCVIRVLAELARERIRESFKFKRAVAMAV